MKNMTLIEFLEIIGLSSPIEIMDFIEDYQSDTNVRGYP